MRKAILTALALAALSWSAVPPLFKIFHPGQKHRFSGGEFNTTVSR
jgi:hypothetical protein